jgi:putative FmdB family regulatory protein
MPIYEYLCPACNSEFELRLSFSAASITAPCPKCHTTSTRLISSFACKTGSNLQATEKAFRKPATEGASLKTKTVKPGNTKTAKRTSKPKGTKK